MTDFSDVSRDEIRPSRRRSGARGRVKARAFFSLVAAVSAVAGIDAAAHHDWMNAVLCLFFTAGTRFLYLIATDERLG